jgi:glycosyltransferase involved in cell wall biosynthesis
VASERSTDLRRPPSVRLLDRLTARWSDRIVAVSAAVRDVLVARDRVPVEKVVVVPTGIDLDAIDGRPAYDVRAELRLEPSVPVVCAVGRLSRVKGHVFLVRALARVNERAHLLLVGGGPEEATIRAEAARCGIGARVHCVGVRADAIPIMKAADVFALPSLQEGLPVVLLEAMACARPIVASDVGGVRELIRAGETGLLVPPADRWDRGPTAGHGVDALAGALSTLLRDRDRARALGRAARRFVERHHTLDREVAALERLYGVSDSGELADRSVAVGA